MANAAFSLPRHVKTVVLPFYTPRPAEVILIGCTGALTFDVIAGHEPCKPMPEQFFVEWNLQASCTTPGVHSGLFMLRRHLGQQGLCLYATSERQEGGLES